MAILDIPDWLPHDPADPKVALTPDYGGVRTWLHRILGEDGALLRVANFLPRNGNGNTQFTLVGPRLVLREVATAYFESDASALAPHLFTLSPPHPIERLAAAVLTSAPNPWFKNVVVRCSLLGLGTRIPSIRFTFADHSFTADPIPGDESDILLTLDRCDELDGRSLMIRYKTPFALSTAYLARRLSDDRGTEVELDDPEYVSAYLNAVEAFITHLSFFRNTRIVELS